MRLDIEATGVTQAGERVTLIGDRARDPRPVLSEIADELLGAERRLFATGRGWAPLKRSTVQRKAREGLDPRPLHATGRLERALSVRGAPGQLLQITRDELRVGLPRGRSVAFYGRFQKARGRDPLVSRAIVTRIASPRLRDWLAGE